MSLACLLGLFFGVGVSRAQVFAKTTVGQPASPQYVTVQIPNGGSVATVEALTLGMQGLDFGEVSDTCANHTFPANGQCTVQVSFSPTAPGVRQGAVVLLASNNTVLGTAYVSGVGAGGLGVMLPGTMLTAAGNGEWTAVNDGGDPTAANLDLPEGVAFDGAGNMYIADSAHNRVRRVSAASPHVISTIVGNDQSNYSGDNGPAANAELDTPTSVAVDGAGNLYIADSKHNVVRMVNGNGIISTVAGTAIAGYNGDAMLATSAQLNRPIGVTVDAAGNLYIADQGNQRIRKVAAASGVIITVAGNGALGGNGQGTYGPDGVPATSSGLGDPFAVAFDAVGNMYIPDSTNNLVRMVDTNGTITTVAGNYQLGAGFTGDTGLATQAQLYSPSGVLVDVAGDLLVADTQNNRIRMVDASLRNINTIAGNGVGKYAGDGDNAVQAGLYGPYGLAMDKVGDLFVADYFDHRIREVPSNLALLTVSSATRVGQRSSTQDQSIVNLGNAPLVLTTLTPDANEAIDSSVTTCAASGTVPLYGSCTIGAVFAPTVAANPQQGNIDIGTQNANGPLRIVESGEALALNAATVALVSSVNPASYGQPVSLVATVSTGANTGALTGQITFLDGGNPISSAIPVNGGGTATLSISTLAIGAHNITASYAGDPLHTSSVSSALTETVEEATRTVLVASANPAQLHASATLTAVVSPTAGNVIPSGSVIFYDGANVLGSATLDGTGTAAITTSTLTAGVHSVTASYNGVPAALILGSTSAVVLLDVQAQSTTAITSSANPSIYGNQVQLTALVTADNVPATAGTVEFFDGATPVGSANVANGAATLSLSTLVAGQHALTATYTANLNSASSSSPALTQVVNKTTTATAITYNPDPAIGGRSTVLTATVRTTTGAGTPTGTVSFADGSTVLGSAKLSGSGAGTLTAMLSTGAHSIVATYAGDANNNGDSSPTTPVQVVPATTVTTLSANANPVVAVTPLMITATVTGNGATPGGTVTFFADGNSLGASTLDTTGVAHFTLSSLAIGAHALTASYEGDVNDAPNTSAPFSETVVPITTTTTIGTVASAQIDPHLILAATVVGSGGPSPAGTVVFVSNGVTIGSAALDASGVATLTPDLNTGSLTIVAQYAGDSIHGTSTSAPITVTNQAVGFNINMPSGIKLAATQNTTVAITLASTNGFADTIGLGCASLPAMMTCHFSSPQVSLAANGAVSVQLTIDTNAPVNGGTQASVRPAGSNLALAGMAAPFSMVFGLLLWRGRRRSGALLLTLVLSVVGACGLNGCAGLSVNSVAPGTYTVQVTAAGTQSAVMRTVDLSVDVTK